MLIVNHGLLAMIASTLEQRMKGMRIRKLSGLSTRSIPWAGGMIPPDVLFDESCSRQFVGLT